MRETIIPLSPWAKIVLKYRVMERAASSAVMPLGATLIILALAVGQRSWWLGAVAAVTAIVSLTMVTAVVRREQQRLLDENHQDWQDAEQLRLIQEICRESPPQIFQPAYPQARSFGGWRPIQVRYIPDEIGALDITGVMQGTFVGLLAGQFSGTIAAAGRIETTPTLIGESISALMTNDQGHILRFVCPSSRLLQRTLHNIHLSLQGQVDPATHTSLALVEIFGDGSGSLQRCLDELNPSRLNDLLTAALEKPFEARCVVEIYGLEIKPGVVLGISAAVRGETGEETIGLFPVDFFQRLGEGLRHLSIAPGKALPATPEALLTEV